MNNFIKLLKSIFIKSEIANVHHLNKTSKTVISANEHLTLNSQTKLKIDDVKKNIANISKELDHNPEKIFEFIKNSNTEIKLLNNANKLLKIIGEEEGFITELQGLKALYVNLLIQSGFKLSTRPMFILSSKNVEPAIFLHHFYKWYAMQMDLPGFDFKTQENFKRFFKNDKNMDKLPINEAIDLQEAIERDKEATDFALNFVRETQGAKNVKAKMTDGGANI